MKIPKTAIYLGGAALLAYFLLKPSGARAATGATNMQPRPKLPAPSLSASLVTGGISALVGWLSTPSGTTQTSPVPPPEAAPILGPDVGFQLPDLKLNW